ncbi:MAG TPA: hemolysin III family protein [Frankiaceae bacterium]|nr:hemolysin III family protein [Frankiaceae bacterium]
MGTRPPSIHPRDAVRPRLRGWLHAGAFPVSLVAGAVVVALAVPGRPRVGAGVYAATVALLFGTSALYHRVRWSPTRLRVMARVDHSMIFVFIAGTYTPFALLVLPPGTARTVLAVVWGGAAVGILLRVLWLHAPRLLTVPLYIGLGWVAVFVFPDLLRYGGVAAFVLLVVGGVLYSVGAVVYATRRPDPAPRVFGYHEVFHLFVLVAALCHYVAVFFALYARGGVGPA